MRREGRSRARCPRPILVAVSKTVPEAGIRETLAGGGFAPLRREPGAGSGGEIPRPEKRISRS